ncbi:MAG: hypothetical protein AAB793_03330 [Patescibacteria group bacterium]
MVAFLIILSPPFLVELLADLKEQFYCHYYTGLYIFVNNWWLYTYDLKERGKEKVSQTTRKAFIKKIKRQIEKKK